jgi:hypothetical protein
LSADVSVFRTRVRSFGPARRLRFPHARGRGARGVETRFEGRAAARQSVDFEPEVHAGERVRDGLSVIVELEDGVIRSGVGILAHDLRECLAGLVTVVERVDGSPQSVKCPGPPVSA